MARAVYVGLKMDAILGEFAKRAKAKDLKAAAVSQNSAIPGHELMQTAELVDEGMGRAQVEMICISENDCCAQLFERLLGQSFNGTLCANRHKDRRFYYSMGSRYASGTRPTIFIFSKLLKRKLFFHLSTVGLYPGRERTFAPGLETFTSM